MCAKCMNALTSRSSVNAHQNVFDVKNHSFSINYAVTFEIGLQVNI